RKKITCMTGMMIAMTLGMSAGLTIGLIFGVLFSDDLFVSTILGMLAGMVAGFLAGVPISIIAMLVGHISVLMVGMMDIMFLLFLATMLIIIYMIKKEVNGKITAFYRNPLAPVALMGFIFFVFNQIGPVFAGTDSAEQNHSEHKESDNSLLIKANEYDFLP